MPAFGERLRRLRGNKSQKIVAAELQMPITTYSSLENQEQVPRGPLLERLADFFGVPPTYFFPSPGFDPKPTDAARQWLRIVSESKVSKESIAAHAPAEYPDEIKKRFAEKIREKKHDKTRIKD